MHVQTICPLLVVLYVVVTAIGMPEDDQDGILKRRERRSPYSMRDSMISRMKKLQEKLRLTMERGRDRGRSFTPDDNGKMECKTRMDGTNYRGNILTTISGSVCQPWASQTPYQHGFLPSAYPKAGLKNNYCRNPDKDAKGTWCFVMDRPGEWEYCSIPLCPACKTTMDGTNYRGNISTTILGSACQPWASQTPYQHDFLPSAYPNAGLKNNYCRNPDKDAKGPWCYVMDRPGEWEYCSVALCPDQKCHEMKRHLSNWQGGDYCLQSDHCQKTSDDCGITFSADEKQICLLLKEICSSSKETS